MRGLTRLLGPAAADVDLTLPVLMYHSVPEGRCAPGELVVPLGLFREQVAALIDGGWVLLGLSAALRRKREQPTARVVALTFDDGLADYSGAAEVVAAAGGSSTLYVATDWISRTVDYGDRPRTLTWEELRALPTETVEIGSHSTDHLPLDLFRGEALVSRLQDSRRLLEDGLGREVTSFAYPHGYNDDRSSAAVSQVAYGNACIIGRRLHRIGSDPFRIPRLHVMGSLSPEALTRMVYVGQGSLRPGLTQCATPAWRVLRRQCHRRFGVVLT